MHGNRGVYDDTLGYSPGAYGRGAEASEPTPDKGAPLPSPDEPYKAAGRESANDLTRLVLVMGKDGFKAGERAYHFLQYVHISMGEFGFWDDGQWFTFIWNDSPPKLVTVRGYELLRICDLISLHRLPWIRMADRDFRPGNAGASSNPFISRIEITDWTPKRKAEED